MQSLADLNPVKGPKPPGTQLPHSKASQPQERGLDPLCITPSHLLQGNDKEGPTTSTLSHDSDEVGVHGTEVIVVDAPGDGYRVVAVLLGGYFAKDMAELGAAVLGVP